MAVYVDRMRAQFGRMVMCHMIADTSDELMAMADLIGIDRRWCQARGTYREHFDISLGKRELAIIHGAIEITRHELADLLRAKRRKFHP